MNGGSISSCRCKCMPCMDVHVILTFIINVNTRGVGSDINQGFIPHAAAKIGGAYVKDHHVFKDTLI